MKKNLLGLLAICCLILSSCTKKNEYSLVLYSLDYTITDWLVDENNEELFLATIDVPELDEHNLTFGSTRVFLEFHGGSRELPINYDIGGGITRSIDYELDLNKIHFELTQSEAPTDLMSLDFKVMIRHIP